MLSKHRIGCLLLAILYLFNLTAPSQAFALSSSGVSDLENANSTDEAQLLKFQNEDDFESFSENDLENAIQMGAQQLLELQNDDGYWVANIRINPRETAYFILAAKYLGFENLQEDMDISSEWLINHVNTDGGWGFFDSGGKSDISITAIVRLALLVNGIDETSEAMQSSLIFIENNGGVSNSDLFCKFFYYLFDLYREPWEEPSAGLFFPPLEILELDNNDDNSIYATMAWGREAGIAMSVIREYKSGGNLQLRSAILQNAENWIVSHQLEDGCWYTLLGTLLNMIALSEIDHDKYEDRIEWGMDWINSMRDADGYQRRFRLSVWDSSISIVALREAGVSPNESRLLLTAKWLMNAQTQGGGDNWSDVPSGGWSYNEYNLLYPDCDDTALAITALNQVRFNSYSREYEKRLAVQTGIEWLMFLQNDDGGFGTFSRFRGDENSKNYGAPMSSVEDSSVADITGHVLTALGSSGYSADDQIVQDAVAYLRRDQNTQGAWYGRWGLSYLYGTSLVLIGLADVDYDMGSDFIIKGADWLIANQNDDGGWGEHFSWWSEKNGISFTEMGVSTTEQTAWVIMALLRVNPEKYHDAIEAGVGYLISYQKQNGNWNHEYYTVLGLNPYKNPYYSVYFPLQALSLYAKTMDIQTVDLLELGLSMEQSASQQMVDSFAYDDLEENVSRVFNNGEVNVSFDKIDSNVYSLSIFNNSNDLIENLIIDVIDKYDSEKIIHFEFNQLEAKERLSQKIYFTAGNESKYEGVEIRFSYQSRGETIESILVFPVDVEEVSRLQVDFLSIMMAVFIVLVIILVIFIIWRTDHQILKYSINNLTRNRLRTVLAFIGIVIGISATAGTISVGESFRTKLANDFESFGSGRIVLIPEIVDFSISPPIQNNTSEVPIDIDENMIDEIRELDNIKGVCPVINSEETVTFKGEEIRGYIQFVDVDTFELTTPLSIESGEILGRNDFLVANIGFDVWSGAFSEQISVNDTLQIGNYDIRVKGLFSETAGVSGKIDSIISPNIIIYLPMEAASKFVQSDHYDLLEIKVMDINQIAETDQKINILLQDEYPNRQFSTVFTEKLQTSVTKILVQLDKIVAIIGFFCLIVSGIGIMNLMITNMNERRNEIGILKALGALKKTIFRMFIVELFFLGVISGTCGFLGGLLVVLITQSIADIYYMPSVPLLLGLSLLLGLGIVLLFGMIPVFMEIKKDPIDSIRKI